MFKKFFQKSKKVEVETSKPNMKNRYVLNMYYILISNNQDNMMIAKYIGEHHLDHDRFTLPIFEDVLTKEQYTSMAKAISYTKERFKTLSKLDYSEVIELMFHLEMPYIYDTDKLQNSEYIDPQLNYEKYINALES